jgi:hypothetical protein
MRPTTGQAARVLLCALACGAAGGCAFGARALEGSHRPYNEAVKEVDEEQLLLNLVRIRYNDDPSRLDVGSIVTQYELDAMANAQPFLSSASSNGLFRRFEAVLPSAEVGGANRPTITFNPLEDPETVRSFLRPGSLDSLILLAETSWPVSTILRLWVESMNGLPNAPSASGPPRGLLPRFAEFQRAADLLQALQDRDAAHFVREEKLTEVGSSLPADGVTAAAQVEAARNGLEYRRQPDGTWILIRRDRQLALVIAPDEVHGPEMQELCALLHLQPGLARYLVTVGGSGGRATISLFPRSPAQALFYLSHGVDVPVQHLRCGIAVPTLEPDGKVFDWQQVMGGLFTVHSSMQHCRPKHALVAVKYCGCWFYVDDRDNDSKITFTLMMVMSRANQVATPRGGPALTLPVGR